mgnify:CR=1 FL=1
MDMKTGIASGLRKSATFTPNKDMPIYNWFYYKEGFSRDLVMMLLDRHARADSPHSRTWHTNSGESSNVLDPFCGVGTTNLACKERGIDSYGFDASPLCVLAARAKTHDYDTEELKEAIKQLQKSKFQRQDIKQLPSHVRQYFNPHTLEDVLFFRQELENFSGKALDFIMLGLITSTTRCSWMYKDGAVLKARKKPVPVFRKFYTRTLWKMLSDVQKMQENFSSKPCLASGKDMSCEAQTCQTFIEEGDARNLKIDSQFIDLVITSPPYLNKIEYTKIYSVEEFLFFGQPIEKRGMRAFIGLDAGAGPEAIFPELPPAANAYFADMKQVLKNLKRACKLGAKVCIVVGDGCLPEGVVHVDSLLPQLAEKEGFSLESVEILGVRQCTKNRVEKIGQMEECLITFTRD